MQTLDWYLNRLSRMSLREMAHRGLRESMNRLGAAGLFLASRPPIPNIGGELQGWISGGHELDRAVYENAANEILAGRCRVFRLDGHTGILGRDWNRDPLTGVRAPMHFGKLLDYRDEKKVGNIKYLWEPNRHLELVTLAQAYAVTDNTRYLDGVQALIESWLEQCPYARGPNWSSSLEAGIRLINWSLTWQLIGGHTSAVFSGRGGQELQSSWLDSIYQHAHFIHHNYSRYSSANNHLIGEAAGVFVAACTWPYWKELEGWADKARRTLVEAAATQTHDDGVNKEQAIAYQQFVLDFFLLAALAGRARNVEFPREYWQTIEKMIEFIQAVMDMAGNVPMFGDADDGFVVRLSQEPGFCPFRSLLATGAILCNRTDFASKAGVLDDKTRFLLGEQRWKERRRNSDAAPSPQKQRFDEGGYYVLGSDLGEETEIRLVADAGPLGYLSIAAHGHADALSVILSVAGHEVLIDPGTFSYHTDPVWREYFRSTAAHNTVRVDGLDQSVQGGNFMWLSHARSQCLTFEPDRRGGLFVGEHDGYRRLTDPVVHRRTIRQTGPTIEITDDLFCKDRHVTERCWHFSEQCDVSIEADHVLAAQGRVRITLSVLEADAQIRRMRGPESPPGGWVSRRFDEKVPSDSVFFVNRIQGTCKLKTRIHCEIL